MFCVGISFVPKFSSKIIRNKTGNIRGAIKAHQVCYTSSNARYLKAICFSDRKRSHVAAITPTAYYQTIGVSNTHLYDLINTTLIIFKISKTPVVVVRKTEIFSV